MRSSSLRRRFCLESSDDQQVVVNGTENYELHKDKAQKLTLLNCY